MEWTIPLGALVVSLATLVYTAIQHKQLARKAFVDTVSQKIKELEESLRDCERTRMRLERDKQELLTEVVQLRRNAQ